MATNRPFFNRQTASLAAEFEERKHDREFLRALDHELTFRDSRAAVALAGLVSNQLSLLAAQHAPRDKQEPASPPTVARAVPGTDGLAPATPRRSDPVEQPARAVISPPDASVRRMVEIARPGVPARFRAAPVTDRPRETAILDAWTALEVLSPQSYRRPEQLVAGDRKAVAYLESGKPLPWAGAGETSRPKKRLYYQVVLGSIDLETAVKALLAHFGDTRADRPSASGKAILALITLDRTGRPVDSPAVAISSFGWGVPLALAGKLSELARWPAAERPLLEALDKRIRRQDDEGELIPLSYADLADAFTWLTGELGLARQFTEPPHVALRVYQYYRDDSPPEPALLNSFFLGDLRRARDSAAAGKTPPLLRRYLGSEVPEQPRNLREEPAVLEEAVRPAEIPPARWPGARRESLVLLQQAAVNLAGRELREGGLLAVNGPPGTGKTTLLRDVLAFVLTSRAEAMLSFDRPAAAFEETGKRIRAGAGWIQLHRLDPRLRGFEMVVASSNNKAVENVTAELPIAGAVAPDAGLRHFRTISDALSGEGKETWGLTAAVLGNSKNRYRFSQSFWHDPDVGLRTYLAAASGSPQFIQETDPQTGKVRNRLPRVVVEEDAPKNSTEALRRWNQARDAFRASLQRSREMLATLEVARELARAVAEWEREVARAAGVVRTAGEAYHRAVADAGQARRAHDDVRFRFAEVKAAGLARWQEAQGKLIEEREAHRSELERRLVTLRRSITAHTAARPGFLRRLLSRAGREWEAQRAALRKEEARLEEAVGAAKEAEARARKDLPPATPVECLPLLSQVESASGVRTAVDQRLATAAAGKDRAQDALNQASGSLAKVRSELARLRSAIGDRFVDDAFLEREPQELQTAVPWVPAVEQRLRDEVFVQAVRLHKAFIDAAAAPLRHNLAALMQGYGRGLSDEHEVLVPDLWASLFLVVPLVSTTFASVDRMLGNLPVASLGWLLVDEAGQAVPQAAVGALLRSERALIVGDPIQVEPVVTLPDTLTAKVCQHFGVDPQRYDAPGASVQTLADVASPYVATFPMDAGSRTVGVPLLVHRRCAEPMFGIANAVAYAGLMVHATPARESRIRDVLGASAWMDVQGTGADKWSPEEGEVVLRLLRRLADSNVMPDLYLVTPFVIVAEQLRKAVQDSGVLSRWTEQPWAWVNERIGTVHTVQGREAEAVIFVLGAPNPDQRGARNWAGGRPNLLNVAVTRAKECLYVVGNRSLWRQAGVFRELDRRLP